MTTHDHPKTSEAGGNPMFNPSHAQVHASHRQAELLNVLAAERVVRSAREDGASPVIESSTPAPRIIDLVTDALSGIAGAIAAARRRPHWA